MRCKREVTFNSGARVVLLGPILFGKFSLPAQGQAQNKSQKGVFKADAQNEFNVIFTS